MPHGVHWKSTLPSRKSRKSGVWFSRQRLRLPSANDSLNSLRDCVDAGEVLLVGRLLVRVGGREHHLVDLQLVVQEVEHVAHRLRRVGREEGRVRVDAEAALAAPPDRLDRLVEGALALDELVVALAHAVEVHDPREVRRRLEQVHLLLHQDPVRAQVDELLALDQLRARSRAPRGARAARRRRSRPSARPTPRSRERLRRPASAS